MVSSFKFDDFVSFSGLLVSIFCSSTFTGVEALAATLAGTNSKTSSVSFLVFLAYWITLYPRTTIPTNNKTILTAISEEYLVPKI